MANEFMSEARLEETSASQLAAAISAQVARPAGVRDLRQLRISKRESQQKFWGRFGVTQSSGSRFETGLSIPAPVAILLKLYVNGTLSDGDLQE
jgi:hypothetical protein